MPYTIKEKKPLPRSEYLLVLEIPAETVAREEIRVLAEMKRDAELPGFRKGFVPEKLLREKSGTLALWEEAATRALAQALADVMQTEKLHAIGRPRVEALKLAPANSAEFRVTLALYPALTLPDYKKLAAAHNARPQEKHEVEEKDIDAVIADIRKQHTSAAGTKECALTDTSVKAFDSFANVADFRAKVKEGIAAHREEQAREKRRAKLLDGLVSKTDGEVPDILVESALSRMESELSAQIEGVGAKLEDYFKEINKDRETVRGEWRKDAEKRARRELMLAEIARAEKIVAPPEEIDAGVKHLLERYKDAREENARLFVENTILNQKTIAFLEDQK